MLNPLAAPVDSDSPVESPGLWTLLAFVRREFQSILFNSHPTASPIITSQTDDVVTGNIGAVDPDGDRLVYTVIGRGPALGRVSIDQATGAFTYTPVVDFSVLGGSDRFTVEISDETSPHLHGLDSLWEVPVNLIRGIPVIGSLLSDFLPRTSTTATVTIDFPGTGDLTDLKFPDGFHWGTSTSGFQSEMGGGAPLDENSDWWHWLHDPLNKGLLGWKSDALPENGPGSYLEYATDAELAADGVGADTFRMGIEWSRIFPNSTASVDISGGITDEVLEQLDALADQDEVAHYADVLSTLHAYQLDPMVTINHFTLPDWVNDPESARIQEALGLTPQEKAGWVSDSTVSEFEKYSAYLAWKFGDEVTNWIVLNEPMNSMIPAYFAIPFTTGFPPAVLRPDLMAKGLLNQAAAYSASYDIIHQLDPDANVGAALSMWEWRGANPASAIDQQAAAQFSDFFNKWFPDAVIKGEVDANFDGVIEPDEIHPELAGRMDFFGVNYYGLGSVIGFGGSPFPSIPVLTGYPQFATLLNVLIGGCPAEECSDTPEMIKPSGLRDMIDIAASYGKPLWITENGLADADDSRRASYLVRHLAVVEQRDRRRCRYPWLRDVVTARQPRMDPRLRAQIRPLLLRPGDAGAHAAIERSGDPPDHDDQFDSGGTLSAVCEGDRFVALGRDQPSPAGPRTLSPSVVDHEPTTETLLQQRAEVVSGVGHELDREEQVVRREGTDEQPRLQVDLPLLRVDHHLRKGELRIDGIDGPENLRRHLVIRQQQRVQFQERRAVLV